MPLSKVRKLDRSPPTQAELNRRVGGAGKAICAFDLIQCDRQYVDLMKTYLGRTVLCDTMDTAKVIPFNLFPPRFYFYLNLYFALILLCVASSLQHGV